MDEVARGLTEGEWALILVLGKVISRNRGKLSKGRGRVNVNNDG